MFDRFTEAQRDGLLTGGSLTDHHAALAVPSFKISLTAPESSTKEPFMTALEYSDRRHDRMLFLMNDWPQLKHTWEYYEEYNDYERYVPNLMNAFKPAVDAWHKCMRLKAAEKTRRQNLTK